jgi:hypothetical protein
MNDNIVADSIEPCAAWVLGFGAGSQVDQTIRGVIRILSQGQVHMLSNVAILMQLFESSLPQHGPNQKIETCVDYPVHCGSQWRDLLWWAGLGKWCVAGVGAVLTLCCEGNKRGQQPLKQNTQGPHSLTDGSPQYPPES